MVDSGLVQAVLSTGGAGIAIAFILVVTGLLVPKYAYEREKAVNAKLEMANEKLQDALDRERTGHSEATSGAATANSLIEALVSVARGGGGGSGDIQASPGGRDGGGPAGSTAGGKQSGADDPAREARRTPGRRARNG